MATMTPSTPVMMNIQRQLKASNIIVRTGGAMHGPIQEDAMMIPVGVPRSRTLNHSLTTLAAAGYCGASPTPRTARATRNWDRLFTSPQTTWARACSTLNLRTGIAFCPSWMRRSHADGHAMDEAGAAARGVPAQGQDPAPGSAAHDVGHHLAASERGQVARHPG